MSLYGQHFDKALAQGALDAAVGTVAGIAGNKISVRYDKGLDPMMHKLLHGFIGGLSGAALRTGVVGGFGWAGCNHGDGSIRA